jgi:excisionase family DNA binding protein
MEYMTLQEVAAREGVCTKTVRAWISQGKLVAYKRGGRRIYIDPASLDGLYKPIRTIR